MQFLPEKEVELGAFSMMHWLVVLLVALIALCAGKFPRLMRDLGEGIKSFKTSLGSTADDRAAINRDNRTSPSDH